MLHANLLPACRSRCPPPSYTDTDCHGRPIRLPQRSTRPCRTLCAKSTGQQFAARRDICLGSEHGLQRNLVRAKADVVKSGLPKIDEDKDVTWRGEDEFTVLGDRRPEAPLPLPSLKDRRRVALVRHGQSTWNAAGRVQGCTNYAVLTAKGEAQAEVTRRMVSPRGGEQNDTASVYIYG